jgi:hypothetical protein
MTTNLYGYQCNDLEAVRSVLEQTLNITFYCERTLYRSFYSAQYSEGIQFLLQSNWDSINNELMEEQYPHLRVLLYVRSTLAHSSLRQQLIIATNAFLLEQRDEG